MRNPTLFIASALALTLTASLVFLGCGDTVVSVDEPDEDAGPKFDALVPNNSTPEQKNHMRKITEFSSRQLRSLRLLQEALRDPNSNRFARVYKEAGDEAALATRQFMAEGLQYDTKLKENGVLNFNDERMSGEAIFGLDPTSFKSLLQSNPELASVVDNQIKAVQRNYQDAIRVNNFSRGSSAQAQQDAAGAFRSSSKPNFSVDPALMKRIGIVPNNQPAPTQPSPQPNQSATPPAQGGTRRIRYQGSIKPVSAEDAAILVEAGEAQYVE